MRSLRRYVAGVSLLLMAVQAIGAVLPTAGGCCPQGSNEFECTCCRKGSGEECPMCSRAQHASTRCRADCQRHGAPQPSVLDESAILPARAAEFVDLATGAGPAIADLTATSFVLVPPSPPPWSASSLFRSHVL
jgi:hypothetical protein